MQSQPQAGNPGEPAVGVFPAAGAGPGRGDSTGTTRIRLCWWAEVGGGWSAVGVAECGAQRSEDVYFPGQVQGVLVGGS